MRNSQSNVSRLEILPVRQAFAHEAHDFTRWLAKHIDVLSERLGLQLSVTSREERTGDFITDLVCEDENGKKVIIENQLERTNHSHLGQLLTYLVNHEAETAIWIATELRPEHQKVIEWLNEMSSADLGFYIVKVEAARIGDSPYAPLFTILAGPDKKSKEIGEEKKQWAARHHSRFEFWTELLAKSKSKTKIFGSTSPGRFSYIGMGAGVMGIKYLYTFSHGRGSVELYIDTEDEKKNKHILEKLLVNKKPIELAFGAPLDWERMEGHRKASIRKIVEGKGDNDFAKKESLQDRMIDSMIKLHAALGPFIEKLDL
ncbi:hypothetical protein D3C87_339280 [compost metagenome]